MLDDLDPHPPSKASFLYKESGSAICQVFLTQGKLGGGGGDSYPCRFNPFDMKFIGKAYGINPGLDLVIAVRSLAQDVKPEVYLGRGTKGYALHRRQGRVPDVVWLLGGFHPLDLWDLFLQDSLNAHLEGHGGHGTCSTRPG